jgi:hypothetical protein
MFDEVVYELDTDDAERFFEYAGYMARRIETPLHRVRRSLLERIEECFDQERSPDGVPWDDLAPSYKTEKESIYGHIYPMLVGDGTLRRKAISPRSTSISNFGGEGELDYYLDVEYAAAQNFGGWWDSGGIDSHGDPTPARQHPPPRPFFDLAGFDHIVEGIFFEWLEEIKAGNKSRRGLDLPNPIG